MKNSKSRNRNRSEFIWGWAFILPTILGLIILNIIPLFQAAYESFFKTGAFGKGNVFVGLDNYRRLISDSDVWQALLNTFKYAILTGPGGYVISFMLAWLLAQLPHKPRTVLALILYLPSMLGGVFMAVIWKTLFSGDQSGYINSILLRMGLIDTPIQFLQDPKYLMTIVIVVALWSSMGVGFLSTLAGMLNIDSEQYEAAHIDGVKNRFQEIMYVTIPNMKPQMLFGAVMAIVSAFNNGGIGVALSGVNPTPEYSAQLITNHIDDYGYARYEMGYAAALSVVLLAVIMLFTKIAYKLFGEKD